MLPSVKGTLTENAPLGAESWFRCGGTADLLFQPADLEDLQNFLKQYPADRPLCVLGGMANTIIRDGGVRGCVIRLGKAFSGIEIEGDHITAQAGVLNGTIAARAVKAGLGGLEFLSGIPGTLGGAVFMNAGAYGAEVKDVLIKAVAVDRQGDLHELSPQDLQMSYRHSELPEGYIIVGAELRGVQEDPAIVKERLSEIKTRRNDTQPITEITGGSTFANPDAVGLEAAGLPNDLRAWQLVEKVGGRGLQIGSAQMSEKHCNFMINTGNASAADLENLGDELIRRVKDETGYELCWEIKRLGDR